MTCTELLNLRMAQLEEKARFLEFQASMLSRLSSQQEDLKAEMRNEHDRIILEQEVKVNNMCDGRKIWTDILQDEQAVDNLEARQLEDEIKLKDEQDLEKRAVMLRLRYMEAYCQNPTPPPTPVGSSSSGRPSVDTSFLERRVTEKDYNSLAQQYRERDIMDTLHESKINVLRGKQKKAVERLIARREQELENMRRNHMKQLAAVDLNTANQEAGLRATLDQKRMRLESRWRTQALIERTKLERDTGMTYAALSDVLVYEPERDTHAWLILYNAGRLADVVAVAGQWYSTYRIMNSATTSPSHSSMVVFGRLKIYLLADNIIVSEPKFLPQCLFIRTSPQSLPP
jgi:hypothetical protein